MKRILLLIFVALFTASLPVAATYQIYVRQPSGEILTLDVSQNHTILEVKAMIQDRTDFNPIRQRLIYAGKELENGRTLGDYNIGKEAILHLVYHSIATKGKLPGAFSVSATKQVWFSQGNLQHSGDNATGTWSFAANQYDRYGTNQTDDHRDLFGWGTKTAPNNTSTNDGDYTWADWGENKISNGGNLEGVWSTLTADEWQYLFDRTNYRTMATVHSVPGLIMMPDGWTATNVNPTITVADYTTNTLTDAQWTVLEGQGCVFLPTNGWRDGTDYYRTDEHAIYWTSTSETNTTARDAYIDGIGKHDIWTNEPHGRHLGFCVRLVLQYWQGSGTAADPYLINNVYDWNKLSYLVNNGHSFADTCFRLTADIDVTTIVGSSEKPFSGTFDSNGHSIQTMMNSWSYISNGNVLSAYGEGGYTAENPLSITISAPADLQFDGTYKPATISNTSAWTVAGLTVPTILYDGKTNAPSLLGTYTASISAGGETAELTYTIKTVINYQSFFDGGLTQGKNFDIDNTGTHEVGLNNSENKGVYWDSNENCAVFDGEAYLQIDNPLGHVTAETGFTLTMEAWISSDNNGSGKFYRSTGAYVNKNGWQRLFELSDGNPEDCIFINAGNANSGTAHLMWCLRKGYGANTLEVWNNTGKSYNNQWCTVTMVVAPGGYTTLYVNGEVLTHSSSSDIPKITNVLNYISSYNKCYIGTSIFEVTGNNADGFFFGKIRGFQTAEGALMPYFDGTNYHYLLSYATNGGNPITGTFEAAIPTTLPTPTHPHGAEFLGWYTDEQLTIPAVSGTTLTRNTALYAKWRQTLSQANDNSSFISTNNGLVYDITLGRTMNAGGWNTFCVPFEISSSQIESVFGSGTEVRELGSSDFDDTTKALTLNFTEATSIQAGKPYLVYLGSGSNVVNPTFEDVTIVSGTTTKTTDYANFMPVMNPTSLTGGDKSILFVTGGDKLTYPSSTGNINGFRAYFQLHDLPNEARSFAMCFEEGNNTTGVIGVKEVLTPEGMSVARENDNSWYTLDGRKIANGQKPNAKGIYIVNGKKTIIK